MMIRRGAARHTAEPMAAPLTPLSLCSALPTIGGRHGTYRQSFLLNPDRQEQLSKLKAYTTYNQTKRQPLTSLLALFRPVDNFCSHWMGRALRVNALHPTAKSWSYRLASIKIRTGSSSRTAFLAQSNSEIRPPFRVAFMTSRPVHRSVRACPSDRVPRIAQDQALPLARSR